MARDFATSYVVSIYLISNTLNSMTKQITASEMGKIGGAKKSAAKTKSCRENAKRPRKKKNKVKDQNQNNVTETPWKTMSPNRAKKSSCKERQQWRNTFIQTNHEKRHQNNHPPRSKKRETRDTLTLDEAN